MDEDCYELFVEGSEVSLSCRPGETVMECAWRHGYYWPTLCGGIGECGTCRFELIEGAENLGAETESEALMFRRVKRIGSSGAPVRLACCAKVQGPVRLRRGGVVPR